MSKFPLFGGGRGDDTKYGSKRLNILWRKHLKTTLAILTLAIIIAACSLGGSSRPPVANNSTSTAGVSATSTADTTAGPLTTPSAQATATAGATTGPGARPTTGPGVRPTNPPGAQPTNPPGIQPTNPPGVQPTATPIPQPAPTATPTPLPPVTVWIQVTDSCKQALSGGTFSVVGPGVNTITARTAGSSPQTLQSSTCPIPHGSCTAISTGCTTTVLPVPSSGSATYSITIYGTATGQGTNVSYAVCNGGSVCPRGPEQATVHVNSDGSISATTLNIYPDGTSVTYGPFTTSQSDPIMFHEFGVAGNMNIQCDGDSDADDWLTGTPGTHCDSDKGDPNH